MASVLHTAVWVDDPDTTRDFYTDVLGLVDSRRSRSGDERNIFLQDPDGTEVQFKHDPAHPVDGGRSAVDHLAFAVEDLETAVDDALDAGSDLLTAPYTNDAGTARIAYVTDPNGYAVELVEPLE